MDGKGSTPTGSNVSSNRHRGRTPTAIPVSSLRDSGDGIPMRPGLGRSSRWNSLPPPSSSAQAKEPADTWAGKPEATRLNDDVGRLRAMTGEHLLHRIGNPYEERYCAIRRQNSWPSLANPLHVALLLTDFDTELCMNGIVGFLENSTGAYLDQTIDAFRLIGAEQTAATLSQIRETMRQHGVSHQALRSDFHGSSEFQIMSFSNLHPGRDDFAAEVGRLAEALYLYDCSRESPFSLLETYLEKNSAEMLAQLESTVA